VDEFADKPATLAGPVAPLEEEVDLEEMQVRTGVFCQLACSDLSKMDVMKLAQVCACVMHKH